jgi:hypothetical protein
MQAIDRDEPSQRAKAASSTVGQLIASGCSEALPRAF